VRVALRVPPEAFEPAPKVSSAVVVLEPHATRALTPEREAALWGLVQSGFRERRKMLRNVLARQLHRGSDGASGPLVGQAGVDAALAAAGIAGDRRPQTLSVDDWLHLLEAFA
jgi:16S rRNA (adenine1518-N6/adenine1519-N6)-dimethyltransferase